MSDERQPDQSEDPRKQGTGQGYPESNPADDTPDAPDRTGDTDAPSTSSPNEGDAGQATGNPDAAG